MTGLALLATAAAAGLPPITDPPSGEHHRGKFVWFDLVTTDVAGARRFYGELLGWTFEQTGTDQDAYTLATVAGAPVAGIARRPVAAKQQQASRWVSFISVADVTAGARQVTASGGRLLIPEQVVAGRGTMVVLADPDGAPFGLIDSVSGDPPDVMAEVGEWIWAVYQSPDAGSAAAFYQDIGGYEVIDDDRFPGTPHFLLAADGYTRASLAEIPPERLELRPAWLYFVRVSDIKASLAQVVRLGGKVLVETRPEALNGRIAVITDPGGAPLGLMEWDTDADTED